MVILKLSTCSLNCQSGAWQQDFKSSGGSRSEMVCFIGPGPYVIVDSWRPKIMINAYCLHWCGCAYLRIGWYRQAHANSHCKCELLMYMCAHACTAPTCLPAHTCGCKNMHMKVLCDRKRHCTRTKFEANTQATSRMQQQGFHSVIFVCLHTWSFRRHMLKVI